MDALADIEEYIAALPADQRAALEELRGTIREAAPEATEVISYQIPSFRDGDRALVSYAAFKNPGRGRRLRSREWPEDGVVGA